MKIAVVYHSESGNTRKVAQLVAKGAQSRDAVEVKVMRIQNIDEGFLSEAKVVIFGCPTHCGTYSWQMKQWFDTTTVNLNGKLGSTFATADYIGGGATIAEVGLIGLMLVKGMLVYTAGGSDGIPIIHYGVVTIKSGNRRQQHRAKLLGRKVAEKALELFEHETDD